MAVTKDFRKVLQEHRDFLEKNTREFNEAVDRLKASQKKAQNTI